MDVMSPIRVLASRVRDAADPEGAWKAAAALAAVAKAAREAHQLAAQVRQVARPAPDPPAVRKLGELLAADAERVARLIWGGEGRPRVSPVDYLAGLLPAAAPETAAVVAGALERLGDATKGLLWIAAMLRELGQTGELGELAAADDLAARVAAVAADLGAAWAEEA